MVAENRMITAGIFNLIYRLVVTISADSHSEAAVAVCVSGYKCAIVTTT